MNSNISKLLNYKFHDFIKGTEIDKTKKFLMQSQYWKTEQIKSYQLNKIQKLVKYAYENVEYYTELLDSLKIKPQDIRSFEDYKCIPILTKEIARTQNLRLNSKCIEKGLRISKTGGTTGPGMRVVKDRKPISFTWGAYYRWYEWMNVNQGDLIFTFWGQPKVLAKTRLHDLKIKILEVVFNKKTYNSFNLTDDYMHKIISEIEKQKPVLLRGYLSTFVDLAFYMNKNAICLTHIPKAISTTTETLLPNYRKLIEETFKTKVFDQYGCGECGSIAFECSSHNGLHITNEHVYLEVLDNNNNHSDSGRFIVTDLDNYAMPFIRYENGDTGSIYCDDEKCSCGVNLPRIKIVEGRNADRITLNTGNNVHGVFFTDILHEIDPDHAKYISRFQVVQERKGEIDFIIETSHNINKEFEDRLKNALLRYFNLVNILTTIKIPKSDSGKFRYVINKTISI